MITGDNKHAALKVARYLGIDEEKVVYRAYPDTKRKQVEKLQALGQKVMFVGDGINDSPVLAQADVGIAINCASDITQEAADIVLMKDKVDDVVTAISVSRASYKRIKINFIWAFMYNVALIPIAMGVFYPSFGYQLDPMVAGAAMAMSSISVVCSSLFLKFLKAFDVNQYKVSQEFQDALQTLSANKGLS
jgi:P-type E1-E2 ATPase